MAELPEKFLQRLQLIIPEDAWDSTLHSFESIKPPVIRINTLRTTMEHITSQLHALAVPYEPIQWKPDALCVANEKRELILRSHLYQQGLIYNQNLSSQLAVMVLNPQPGEEILDMCAAPGGKTLQIACALQQTGRIAAVEKIKSRFFKLKANLKSQHAGFVHTYLSDAVILWRKTPERFDRILLDAPCSTESRFRRDEPDSFAHWRLGKIKETARKQKKLLISAIHCLKPGGTLLYCTCSFAPEENEAIVDYALQRYDEAISIAPVDLPINNIQAGLTHWQSSNFHPAVKQTVRVLPNNIMDGFFLCKINKTQSTLD